ncbi:polysaccharide biosynthesis protein [Clostridium polynesiense]|uniref:polysaccharide biosynthesis protein n=1 Tax=Clostridium polynesiense TaxID=1325933 RepID=UPI000693FCB7|nr:nucleoside-diphosphate sugar epimerase/dehydratase [Clostridium polynesiense]
MKVFVKYKKFALLFYDIIFINFSFVLALLFRFDTDIPEIYLSGYKRAALVVTLIYIAIFYLFNLYKSLWSLASIDEFTLGGLGNVAANSAVLILSSFFQNRMPYSVIILSGIFITIFTLGFRLLFRIYRRVVLMCRRADKSSFKRVLVVGAGDAGITIVKEIYRHYEMKYQVIGFIDDDKNKQGKVITGHRVLGNRNDIEGIAVIYDIDLIIIAIPSLSMEERKKLVRICNNSNCETKIIPGVYELLDGKVSLSRMRNVDVKDLLGREPVTLDNKGISDYLTGKSVLVTGGGGSIGSELCRQIVNYNPRELIILDIYENNAYDIQNELLRKYPELNLKVIIATVKDRRRLEKVFNEYKPDVVFHAAAHKHVPLMEFNPEEAIKNNVYGTLNTAECADKYGVKRFVLISTDKAVNPTNVMGASKRMCEMVIQAIDAKSRTEFVAVRFGNVLGSNGSVIPLFQKQIAEGGPVTVTHKEITRFFMLIPEAAQLVLQAGAYAKGGEIFVLDMGSPVKIYDLAKDLIRLSGYEPNVDIKLEVTGLRPGEKLYEELLMDEEGLQKTEHNKIFIGKPASYDIDKLKAQIRDIIDIIQFGTDNQILEKIQEMVPTYKRMIQDKRNLNTTVAADTRKNNMREVFDEVAVGKSFN